MKRQIRRNPTPKRMRGFTKGDKVQFTFGTILLLTSAGLLVYMLGWTNTYGIEILLAIIGVTAIISTSSKVHKGVVGSVATTMRSLA